MNMGLFPTIYKSHEGPSDRSDSLKSEAAMQSQRGTRA